MKKLFLAVLFGLFLCGQAWADSTVVLGDDFNDNTLDTDKWIKRVFCYDGSCDASHDWREAETIGQSEPCDLTGSKLAGCGIYTKNAYDTDTVYTLDLDFRTCWDQDVCAANAGYDGIWFVPGDTTGQYFWDEYYGAPATGLFIRISGGCGEDNNGVGIYYDNDHGWECPWPDRVWEEDQSDLMDVNTWYDVRVRVAFTSTDSTCSLWFNGTLEASGSFNDAELTDIGSSFRVMLHSSTAAIACDYWCDKEDNYDNFVLHIPTTGEAPIGKPGENIMKRGTIK